MVQTEGLTHIHLLVKDLDRSLRFYREVFGLQERFRDGPKMVFLRTPGCRDTITLNECESPEDAARIGSLGGIDHFGFRLRSKADLDAAIAEVEQHGGSLLRRGKHPSGEDFAYVSDPDGYTIEL
jgi:catechol 2,3-dioxygenase